MARRTKIELQSSEMCQSQKSDVIALSPQCVHIQVSVDIAHVTNNVIFCVFERNTFSSL